MAVPDSVGDWRKTIFYFPSRNMTTDFHNPDPRHHSLVRGGYSFHFARRMGFEPATMPRRLTKILLLILVTWVPLVVLSILNGHAWGHSVVEPLLADPVIYSRFLFVVPLLELAQVVVETSLGVQMRQFLKSGLVPKEEQPEFLRRKRPSFACAGRLWRRWSSRSWPWHSPLLRR